MPEVNINGPEGRLEGRYQYARTPNAPIALMLHSQPDGGGNMNNKVVYTLYHTFAKRGFSVLRFNFRGVGRSQGAFDRGEGELSDAAAALDWLQDHNPDAPLCWIAGYGFGAWIGMQLLMRRPEIIGFISLAPPANMHDFSFLAPCPSSGLIVNGDKDDQVPPDSVAKLTKKLSQQKDIKIEHQVLAGGDHVFSDRLDELTTRINAYVTTHMERRKLETSPV